MDKNVDLGKGLSLSVICQAGEIALTSARKSYLHLFTLVFRKIWCMLLKYNLILLASFYVKS